MGLILDMSPRSLEEVIYFASYVVIDPGDTPLEKKQLFLKKNIVHTVKNIGTKFHAAMGAEAIKSLLQEIDLEKETEMLERRIENCSRSTSYTCN